MCPCECSTASPTASAAGIGPRRTTRFAKWRPCRPRDALLHEPRAGATGERPRGPDALARRAPGPSPRARGRPQLSVPRCRASRRRSESSARPIDVVHCWPRAAFARVGREPARDPVLSRGAEHPHGPRRRGRRQGVRGARAASRGGHSHTFDGERSRGRSKSTQLADALLVPSEYALGRSSTAACPGEKLVLRRYGYDAERFFARTGSGGARAAVHGDLRRTVRAAQRPASRPSRVDRLGRRGKRRASSSAVRSSRVTANCSSRSWRTRASRCTASSPIPAALMRESDVFVFPSIEEGSALVTYEAQACGCVLVVSEATGARCTDGVDGLVHQSRRRGDAHRAAAAHLGRSRAARAASRSRARAQRGALVGSGGAGARRHLRRAVSTPLDPPRLHQPLSPPHTSQEHANVTMVSTSSSSRTTAATSCARASSRSSARRTCTSSSSTTRRPTGASRWSTTSRSRRSSSRDNGGFAHGSTPAGARAPPRTCSS